MPEKEKVIRAFEQYVYNFIELTTTDEYNHQILEQVLVLLKEQEEEIKTLSVFARADGIDVDALFGRSVK